MREYIRCLRRILDRPTKVRVMLAGICAIGLAGLETAALALLLPLIQLLETFANGSAAPSLRPLRTLSGGSDRGLAILLLVVVLLAFVSKNVLSVFYVRWSTRFILDAEARTSRRLLTGYLQAPYSFHLEGNSADLHRTLDVSTWRTYQEALVALVGSAADAVVIFAIAVVFVVVAPSLALFSGLYFGGITFVYLRVIRGRAAAATAQLHRDQAAARRLKAQALTSAKEVLVTRTQDAFADAYFILKMRMARDMRTMLLFSYIPRFYLETALVVGAAGAGMLVFATRPAANAVATLGLFIAAGFRLLPSINRVVIANTVVRGALSSAEQIAADIERTAPFIRPRQPNQTPFENPEVDIRDLVYIYGDRPAPAIRDISLRIETGQWIAIVGASGAGKSTLLDVMLGLLDPIQGRITIGGEPLSEVRERWQDSIGYVPQNVHLLDANIRDNVAFGIDAALIDEDLLRAAVADAGLGEFIAELPSGLGTFVGEEGMRLSGGQRQRIGIARALYRRPSVLILDEATSSLDAATEDGITKSIQRLRGQVTVVTVAHRPSSIDAYDRIYVLDAGRIVAQGTFTELVATSRLFQRLMRQSPPEKARLGT